ncbi:NAD(P)-binding domain-containing protein [Streptomyces mirabilis]|uniref:NAD(P)-binding domain-containing protein n=1 Tax=Streptomyces mirabilis TaxID=68239 RepID=UPI0021C10D16|nr:NAD(P)-binding domain-containing protein [Streptomyces mirabilis]MCT9111091.1 NAD(P)-binding domain-containing protein [Streptomyces mirabilis]
MGLGNMGGALAANVLGTGFDLVAHDAAGPRHTPPGAVHVADVAHVARPADVVVLSLPDGTASEAVAREIVAAPGRRSTHVVDTSTIGVSAARSVAPLLAASGVAYVDAPVPGGVAGARARMRAVEEEDRPSPIGAATGALWESFAAAEPGADFTRVFPYVEGA